MLKNFLNIIRWPNLIILGVIQLLIYYKLLDHSASVMTLTEICLMIAITIMLGSGGYIINDYYDTDIDRINKPAFQIAGNIWSLAAVKKLYFIIVFIGLILSLILAIRLGLLTYIFIYPLAVVCLWFYSFALKCKPVIGNLWVALFCAGVVGVVVLPDLLLENRQQIKVELLYYIAFAFIATWFREIVKDIEDLEGDAKTNCQTAVVTFGLNFGKLMALAIGALLVLALILWDRQQENQWIKLILTVLQGFTVGAMALVWWAKNNSYYHYASTIIKGIMIGGTLILILL